MQESSRTADVASREGFAQRGQAPLVTDFHLCIKIQQSLQRCQLTSPDRRWKYRIYYNIILSIGFVVRG